MLIRLYILVKLNHCPVPLVALFENRGLGRIGRTAGLIRRQSAGLDEPLVDPAFHGTALDLDPLAGLALQGAGGAGGQGADLVGGVGCRGADGGLTRLIFPEYRETYTENSPAHHFDLQITGGGYAYHSVFRSKALSLAEYDGLWKNYLAAEHDEDSALRLACYRLRWPTDLSEKARGRYGDYLLAHMGEALAYALTAYDGEMLRLLLSLGEIPEAALSDALDLARNLGRTEATALLLESRHRRAPAGRAKRFEL